MTETKLDITVEELAQMLHDLDLKNHNQWIDHPELISFASWLDIAARMLAANALCAALAILSDWPRQSATADGELSADPAVGLANVRRFSRAALALANGKEGK